MHRTSPPDQQSDDAIARHRPVPPEFFTIPARGPDPFFGISRSSYYDLEKKGLLKLARIRKPGNTRGRVLIPYAAVVGDTINTLPQYFGGRQLTDYGVDAVMGQYGDWIEAANNETEMQISRIEQALASIPQGSRYEAPLRQRLYELQFKLPRAKRPSYADLLNLRPLATASP